MAIRGEPRMLAIPTTTPSRLSLVNLYQVEYIYDVLMELQGVTRYYDFTIARSLKAPDGFNKTVLLVNGQFPGVTPPTVTSILRFKRADNC